MSLTLKDKIKDVLVRFRAYGMKGLVEYFIRRIKALSNKRYKFFLDNAKRNAATIPTRGITIIANFSNRNSISKVARDFVQKLHDVDIPFQAFNPEGLSNQTTSEIDNLLTISQDFNINKYSHVIQMMEDDLVPDSIGQHNCRIAFWEFESGVAEVYTKVASAKNVVAFSDFCKDVFAKTMPSSVVHKLVYPFNKKFVSEGFDGYATRERYGIGKNEFVVFYNYDYSSCYQRKNPLAIIEAFACAFKQDKKCRLVFKVNHADEFKAEHDLVQQFVEKEGINGRTLFVTEFLSMQEVYELTNMCDVYVSLHRGEGFGLGIAEAMFMKKPIIVTNYSAPCEFCNSENSILIPYKLTKMPAEVKRRFLTYRFVDDWAEPDVCAATEALKQLYDSAQTREKFGQNAFVSITDYFADENFKKSVDAFLDS